MSGIDPTKVVSGLTENEKKALVSCLNYDDIESQLSDNYSNGGLDEFCKLLGWKKNQVKGLIASMSKKGLGYPDDEGVNGEDADIFWLTEEGVHTAFALIENGEV